MEPIIILPSASLREYIQRYEFYEMQGYSGIDKPFLFIPSFETGFVLILSQTKPIVVKSEIHDHETLPVSSLFAGTPVPIYNIQRSDFRAIRIIFYPGIIHRIYGRPMDIFQDILPDLGYSLDKQLDEVYERLVETADRQKQVWILEDYFVNRLREMEDRKSLFPYLHQELQIGKYRSSVKNLAKGLGIGQRQLQRKILAEMGYPPSQLMRLYRFTFALRFLHQYPTTSLTYIAHEFGYSDQAHFSREFKYFTLQNPKAYQKELQTRILYASINEFEHGGVLLKPEK